MENENTQATEPQTNELESRLAEAEARAEKAEADAKRFKASVDKLTHEAAEKKRADEKKRAEEISKLPEMERIAAERAEELEKLKAKAEADAKELSHLKALSAYKDIADEKTVERLIDCVTAGDHAEIGKVIAEIREKAIKEKETEWKTNRPAGFVGSGSYPAKTKEEILAIADQEERILEMARHKELF